MSCARAQMYPAATAQMYLASSDPQILPPQFQNPETQFQSPKTQFFRNFVGVDGVTCALKKAWKISLLKKKYLKVFCESAGA